MTPVEEKCAWCVHYEACPCGCEWGVCNIYSEVGDMFVEARNFICDNYEEVGNARL